MKPAVKVYLYEADEKFFGEGPCRLLRAIETCGSLRAAAMQMELSYSKAIHMLSRAEEALGYPLTEKVIGGRGGGGSRLTPEAIAFLERYEAYRDACRAAAGQLYAEYFEDQ